MVKINIIKSKKVIITKVSMMLTQREVETMIGKVGQVFFFFFFGLGLVMKMLALQLL